MTHSGVKISVVETSSISLNNQTELTGTTSTPTSKNAYYRIFCNPSLLAANFFYILSDQRPKTTTSSTKYASVPTVSGDNPVTNGDPSGEGYCSSDQYLSECPTGLPGIELDGPPAPYGGPPWPSCPPVPSSTFPQPQYEVLMGSGQLNVTGNIQGSLLVFVTSYTPMPEGMDIEFCPDYNNRDPSSCNNSAFLEEGQNAIFTLPSTDTLIPSGVGGATSVKFNYSINALAGNPLDLLPPEHEEMPEQPPEPPDYQDEPVDPSEAEDAGFNYSGCSSSVSMSNSTATLLSDTASPPDSATYEVTVEWFGTVSSFSLN